MRFRLNLLFIAVLFLISFPVFVSAQFSVTKSTGQNPGTTDGFYYTLPRTVIQVDLIVEKAEQIRGPLAEYTQNYLGTNEFIESDNTSYRVLNLNVTPLYEADPEQVYFVQFPIEKSREEKTIAFQLSELGTLLAVDPEEGDREVETPPVDQTIIVMEGSDDFRFHPDYHRKKKIDTITRKITIDTVSIERFIFKTSWVDKSMEDKANEAALQIANIRDARFNLLTGYQEVNYGESMRYMDSQLSSMERQYLELFLGKELKTYEYHTALYLPDRSSEYGVILDMPGNADVEINIIPRGNTGMISQGGSGPASVIFYRVPEMADIEISHNGIILYKASLPISQLGVVTTAPLDDTRLRFDPMTGALTKIVRE
jgi:hypothetical protein